MAPGLPASSQILECIGIEYQYEYESIGIFKLVPSQCIFQFAEHN